MDVKKMLAVGTAIVGTVAMADGIVSSSVVGYQEVETPAGYSMRLPTFKAITGNFKISDIKVTGAFGAGGDTVQKIEADGSWGALYYYMTLDGSGWLEDGWYKEDQMTPVDDTDIIGVGEALFVSAGSDMTFTYAGEVMAGKPVVQIPTGYSMVGNPTPIQIKISDIEVTGAFGAGGDTVQKIEANGSWGALYYYMTLDGSGWLEDGWYKEDQMTPVDDADVLIVGDGLFVSASNNLTLTFPAAL